MQGNVRNPVPGPALTAIAGLSRPDLPRPPRIITTGFGGQLLQQAQPQAQAQPQQQPPQAAGSLEQPGSSSSELGRITRQHTSAGANIVIVPPTEHVQGHAISAEQAHTSGSLDVERASAPQPRPRRASAQRISFAAASLEDDAEGAPYAKADSWLFCTACAAETSQLSGVLPRTCHA